MKIIENDEAVSPVIGVILMVAITVILAAVIAAFVFGLAGTTGSSKNVGLTVAQKTFTNGTNVGQITWQGGTDLPAMTSWVCKFSNGTAIGSGTTQNVGDVSYTNASIVGERILITAKFTDGGEQVIFDRQF